MSSFAKQVFQLLPRPPSKAQRDARPSGNPIELMLLLSPIQHLQFFGAFVAWMVDGTDFFSVSLVVTRLSAQFGESTAHITLAITLTLLFRGVGAIIFGLISDRCGRKYPLIANLLMVAVLQLGTSYTNSFSAFLGVRALFGIGMGGVWGLAVSMGLESIPRRARGLYSGILQEGYTCGYLLASIINLTLVANTGDWRKLFQVGAGLSLFAALVVAALPESAYWLEKQRAAAEKGHTKHKTKTFIIEAWHALRTNWPRCVFSVLLMIGFNFFSHSSQDLLPTYLQQGKGFSDHSATVATIISNCGAAVGGVVGGFLSQFLGRRLTIIFFCCFSLAFVPLFTLPSSLSALSTGAFFLQLGVQGAWGVVPIFLSEISPPSFRAVWPGLAYQLGNAASSASATIEATAGDHLRTTLNGKDVPDYAKVLQIFVSVVIAYLIILCLFGIEAHSSEFEKADLATVQGAGKWMTRGEDDKEVEATLFMPYADEYELEKGPTTQARSPVASIMGSIRSGLRDSPPQPALNVSASNDLRRFPRLDEDAASSAEANSRAREQETADAAVWASPW